MYVLQVTQSISHSIQNHHSHRVAVLIDHSGMFATLLLLLIVNASL